MGKFTIALLILSLSLISAQSQIILNFDNQINHHLFNGEWEKSDSLINIKLNSGENLVKYNFMKAYNYFYARYLGNNNPFSRDETISQVKKYSWDAIQIGEELEENLTNNFYIGSSYAYLARVYIMEGDFWMGYWNASKAENYFDDVIEENPNFTDAYLNLGVFEYFPAVTVTGLQSVLAWLGGMSGDREMGISYILKVSENGNLFKDEANYILGLMYNFRENNIALAYDYWKSLSDKYPRNNNFQTQVNRSFLGKLIEEKGVDFLNLEFDNLDSQYGVNNPLVLNLLGYSLMNQNRLDEALIVFKVNVKKYPNVANTYDSLAECYLNSGDSKNAIKYYKIAFEKLENDTTITDEYKEFLEENIRNSLNELSSDIDF